MHLSKKKSVDMVIFCFTKEEALWAINFTKKNNGKSFKILAPSAEAQHQLRIHHFDPFDYFKTGIIHNNFYRSEFKKIIKQSYVLTKSIQKILRDDFQTFDSSIIDVLQVVIEAEIYNILFCYQEFKLIEKKWNPAKYYISDAEKERLNGWSSRYFSLPSLIAKFFSPGDRTIYFHAEKQKETIFIKLNYIKQFFLAYSPPKKIRALFFVIFSRLIQATKNSGQPNKDSVIILSSGFNLYYYHRLLSLLNKISNRVKSSILTHQQYIEDEYLLRTSNINFTPVETFSDEGLENRIAKEKKRILQNIPIVMKKLSSNQLDKKVTHSVQQAIFTKLELVLKNYSLRCIRQMALAHKVIKLFQPLLIITTHDPGLSYLPLVFSAKLKKISTLVLIHGWQESIYSMNHSSSHAAVWGPETKRWYVKEMNKSEKKIHPIGFPFLDDWLNNNKAFWQANLPIQKIGASIKLGILLTLYPANTFGWTKFMDDLFYNISKEDIKYIIAIRTHSGQSLPGIESLAKNYNLKIIVNPPQNLDQFILNSDIILGWDTTAFLWAMLYGKPLFCTTQYWGKGLSPIKKYRSAWEPNNAKELIEKIHEIKKHPFLINQQRNGQRKFLTEVVGKLDGQSSERLLKLIEKLSTKKTRSYGIKA